MAQNRHVLTHGRVNCTVTSQEPLPVSIYPLLAKLAEVVKEVDEGIVKALEEERS